MTELDALIVTPDAAAAIEAINTQQTSLRLQPFPCSDGRMVLPGAVRDDDGPDATWHDYAATLAPLAREIVTINDEE
jgi:hypothetical protein